SSDRDHRANGCVELTRGHLEIEVHAEVNDPKYDRCNHDNEDNQLSPTGYIVIHQRLTDFSEPDETTLHGKHNAKLKGRAVSTSQRLKRANFSASLAGACLRAPQ